MLFPPGGKEIKRIQETTGAKLDIDDDGTVHISATSGDGHLQALDIVKLMTMRVEVGQRFKGKVVATQGDPDALFVIHYKYTSHKYPPLFLKDLTWSRP